MKQFALVFFCALLLTGCNDEKNQYQELVFKLMENDQDLLDYSLDPDETTDCVVDTTGKKMPGLFSWDPRRAPIYTAYTDLIKFKLSIGLKKKILGKNIKNIVSFMKKDKKNNNKKVNLVLLKKIGKPIFNLNFENKKLYSFLKKELND